MGNCAYRLSLHIKRAPATRRICAGGDTTGWHEPLRVGFRGGPGEGRETNDAAKKGKLTRKSRIAQDDPKGARPAAFEAAPAETENESPGIARFRWSIRQNVPQESEHLRDTEGFLKTAGLTAARSSLSDFNQIASHIDHRRFLLSCSFEDAAGGGAAIHPEAAGRKMQVAEKHVIAGAPEMGESLLGGCGTIHAQTLGREAFPKKHPETLFIIENEYRTVPEKIGPRSNRIRRGDPSFRGSGKSLGLQAGRSREIDGEGRAAGGKHFGFDVAAVFTNDGHADAEPQSGAAAGTLGGVKGIEDARKRLGADADAVVLNGDRKLVHDAAGTNLDAAGVADFADGLLGVSDQVQKDLNELVGVPDDAGKIGLGMEIHLDIVAAQRVFLQLQRALEKVVEIEGLFLWRSGAREFQKILDDARGAAGLAVRQFQLASGGIIGSFTLAEKLGNADDGSKGIIQLMGDAGVHLSHCGKFLGLDELFLQTLEIGNIAAGENYALDIALFIG